MSECQNLSKRVKITLTNPNGQHKELSPYEFYKLKIKFSKSRTFEIWAADNNLSCMETISINTTIRMNHKGVTETKIGKRFNPVVVDRFLKEMKYIVSENKNS